MRFKSKVMLAAGCICLLGLSVPALGLPKQKGAEKHAPLSRQAKAPPPSAKGSKAAKNKVTQRVLKVQAKARHARQERAARLVSVSISETPKRPLLGWPALVREARKYMGTNPTARSRLWCATFMNMVLAKVGYAGTNSDAARSFTQYGRRISEPQIGAIAVLTRGNNGGQVGVVSGIDSQGNPIIISGNHGKRVGEAAYPRSRVIAYVMPSEERGEPTTQLAARSQPVERQVSERPSSERRAPSEGGIDSPISELIAAIEAEQGRSERPARVSAQGQFAHAHARAPEPRRADPAANLRVARAGTLPLDPRLADMLGMSEKVRARAPRPVQQAAATPQAAPKPMPTVSRPAVAAAAPAPVPPVSVPRQRQVQQLDAPSRSFPTGSFGFR